jgi:hypothetical protein
MSAGWGQEPWGGSPWGGSGGCGWGVQPWGTSPWGPCGQPPQPVQPPQIIGDFERWQRVHREPRVKHERETTRSVLFKVEGVSARAHLGRPTCGVGYGTTVRLRHSWRSQCHVGAVAIQTGTGAWAKAESARALAAAGAALAGVSVTCELSAGVSGNTDVGLTKVRAIKNPTDEEFLRMIAEIL